MPGQNYKDLRVWQQGIQLVIDCYQLTRRFPVEERFGLVSQVRRSAVSIPSNIAEGQGRFTDGEFRNSLSVTSGSLNELETQLIISDRLGFLANASLVPIQESITEIQRMVMALEKRLRG